MKTQILFLTLCISLLLSGCQKAPEAPPAVQAEEAPWEAESQDSQSSYNDSTQGPHSQEFRKIYGEEDGADWWKTAAQEEAKDASGVDQYDDAKTWSWAPYETLYRTDGSRMGLVREADGTRHIGEVPDTKVWIRLKDGTLLSDEPFDACIDIWARRRVRSTASETAPATAIPSAPETEAFTSAKWTSRKLWRKTISAIVCALPAGTAVNRAMAL